MDDYVARIERHRREKDAAFAKDPHSPLAGAPFEGLRYFPVNPALRFEIPLVAHAAPEVVVMATSDGAQRRYRNVGRFEIVVAGEPVTVQAYEGEGDGLFVPFRDRTSGKETYGAGRYLHVPAAGGGRFVLDFNLAYNPFCAYDDAYSCPFPPPANWLQVPIEAGEKTYVR